MFFKILKLKIIPLGLTFLVSSINGYADDFSLNLSQRVGNNERVSRRAFGVNLLYTVSDIERSRMEQLMKGKVGFIRWPGGTVVNRFSYRNDNVQSPDTTNFYEMKQFSQNIGAIPIIGIPLQAGFIEQDGVIRWNPDFDDEIHYIGQNFIDRVRFAYVDNESGFAGGYFFNRFGRRLTAEEHTFAYNRIRNILLQYNPHLRLFANSKNQDIDNWWRPLDGGFGFGWTKYYGNRGEDINDYERDFETLSFDRLARYGNQILQKKQELGPRTKLIRYEWNLTPLQVGVAGTTPAQASIWNIWNQLEQLRGGTFMSAFWPLRPIVRSGGIYSVPYFASSEAGGLRLSQTGIGLQSLAEILSIRGNTRILEHASSQRSNQNHDTYMFAAQNSKRDFRMIVVNKRGRGTEPMAIRLPNFDLSGYTLTAYKYLPSRGLNQDAIVRINARVDGDTIRFVSNSLSLTFLLLQEIRYQSQLVAPDMVDATNSVWRIDLPGRVRVKNLIIDANGAFRRNYKILFRNASGELQEIVDRTEGVDDTRREVAIEEISQRTDHIVVRWRNEAAPQAIRWKIVD